MKTKFEEYVNEIDKLIRDYTKKIHIAELEQICEVF